MSAISRPARCCSSRRSRLAALSSADRSRRYTISSGAKSASRRKLRPCRSITVLIWVLSGVADDGAGHAVAAAAAAAELLSGDRVHFDPGLGELLVGGLVALVGDDHARCERDDVVAVVPLVALRLELVATRGDDLELLEAERVLDLLEPAALGDLRPDAAIAVGLVTDGPDVRDCRLVDRHHVAVAEAEHRV